MSSTLFSLSSLHPSSSSPFHSSLLSKMLGSTDSIALSLSRRRSSRIAATPPTRPSLRVLFLERQTSPTFLSSFRRRKSQEEETVRLACLKEFSFRCEIIGFSLMFYDSFVSVETFLLCNSITSVPCLESSLCEMNFEYNAVIDEVSHFEPSNAPPT